MKLSETTRRYRQSVCARYTESATGVLHLGGHLGQEADKYAKLGKPVLWVEAIPEIHKQLAEKLEKFPLQRAICALLADADDESRAFHISSNAAGISSSLFQFGEFGEGPRSLWPDRSLHMVDSRTMSTVRLDTLFALNGIDAKTYDYWVLDLQGAEKLVLSGASGILRYCRAIYVETSTVEVYRAGVLWPELKTFLDALGFCALWEPELPHDDVLFVRKDFLEEVRGEFHSERYLRHNRERLAHLASLRLDLTGKTVLEVGAGIGDHTGFYLKRNCSITVTEVRPENLAILRDRFGATSGVEVRALDLACPDDLGKSFDVIHCYGILYHLANPAPALAFLARHCAGLLLIETCVSFGERAELNPLAEPAGKPSQAFHGTGCRPTRPWFWSQLKSLMPYVYVTRTQPDHEEFPLDWTGANANESPYTRSVFVASKKPLDAMVDLSSELLMRQSRITRHDK